MRKWLIGFAIVLAALVTTGVILTVRLQPRVKARLEKLLADRFDSDVEIKDISVALFPNASVTATGINLRYHHRTDVPPLISIGRISAHSDLRALLFGVQHDVSLVRLEGLRITIPPGTLQRSQFQPAKADQGPTDQAGNSLPFVVHQVVADGAVLVILPKRKDRDPLEWDIEKLMLRSAGTQRPMTFVASLTNAKPPGVIHTTGSFGPWQKQDPGSTFVGGHYEFRDADMGVFNGLSGILASTGDYDGSLAELRVNGTSDIPNFRVGDGNPVDLKTNFTATVDATNGDTLLHPVVASFRKSQFICNGGVVGTTGIKGKKVTLDVVAKKARIEDILLLVLKGKDSPMTGDIDFQSKFILPQGNAPVLQKLYLNGRFGLKSTHFASHGLQDRLDTFSQRSRGLDPNEANGDVASNFHGRFILRDSLARFSQLSFNVPGILIQLDGAYGLRSEQIDFHGDIRLQGKLSNMTTGWKSILLKAANPFFRRNGQTVLPIKIEGTKSDPKFGLDFHRKSSRR